MLLASGDVVIQPEFGQGKVVRIFGGIAVVDFFGEEIEVPTGALTKIKTSAPQVVDHTEDDHSQDKVAFRRAFEAINLGVVPPDPSQLIALTIRSSELKEKVSKWLVKAPTKGLCKVAFGYYGAGKSHFLKFVRCMAIEAGWVVAYLEFDPKAADPAKPHLVYQNLTSALEFPPREDGRQSKGFMDFIKEVRDSWWTKDIRHNPIVKHSPWFSGAFEVLLKYPHMPELHEDYRDACLWLAGNSNAYNTVNRLAKEKGLKVRVPRMPVTKETADIYVSHLVVINALCKLLGYRGLMIVLDEAEHVRGYNVRRRERANNFFDLLARAAHSPDLNDDEPVMNDHGVLLPPYWENGPHFGLFVGLTEADTFLDSSLSLRDACVFLRTEADRILLSNPDCDDYKEWCKNFLGQFQAFYPLKSMLIASDLHRQQVVDCLAESYSSLDGVPLRNRIKLASLVPCILLSHPETTIDELLDYLRSASENYLGNGNGLPWE